MDLKSFIEKRKYLVWDVKDPKKLSASAVVEACLKHGDWKDFQALTKILGIKRISSIFKNQISKKRCNYSARTKNYFTLYFAKNASRNS